mgnify:CR=1 FL=1|tara:strand:- start:485 stop:1135 length:651 start_codon:yes stop_codon:yes gene_type:complete
MSNLFIYPIHKSASSLQKRIYHYINFKLEYETIICKRLSDKRFSKIKNLEKFFIVLRHPLNTLISQYYSFGWTHSNTNFNKARFLERERIRQLTLDDYILESQKSLYTKFNFSYTYINKIIKYENMMNKPDKFLEFITRNCNAMHLLDEIKDRFIKDFMFDGIDLSQQIVDNKVISHKRNLDDNEYQKKLKKSTLDSLNPETKQIIETYSLIDNIL